MDRSRPPGTGGVQIGSAAAARVLAVRAAEWDGVRIVPPGHIGDGDQAFVLGESSGRHKAAGKEFCSPFPTHRSGGTEGSPSSERTATRLSRETRRNVIGRYQARDAFDGVGRSVEWLKIL
jgi:hypothetical protein